jgi:hypothetical protein
MIEPKITPLYLITRNRSGRVGHTQSRLNINEVPVPSGTSSRSARKRRYVFAHGAGFLTSVKEQSESVIANRAEFGGNLAKKP